MSDPKSDPPKVPNPGNDPPGKGTPSDPVKAPDEGERVPAGRPPTPEPAKPVRDPQPVKE